MSAAIKTRKTKTAAALAKLPPQLREIIRKNPQLLQAELKNRESQFPGKDFVPNIAQSRFFDGLVSPIPELEDYPTEHLFIGGNGSGKTCTLAIFLIGAGMGKEFLNTTYFSNIKFFDYMRDIRRKRVLRGRIVCDTADVEENGSVVQNVKDWLPLAKFSGAVGGGKKSYTKLTIPAPEPDLEDTVVDIKTHGQTTTAHAGPNLDFVLFNEPPPQDIYEENAARVRKGGYLFGFMTPLKAAPYLIRIIERNEGTKRLRVTSASIWDNCKDIPGTRGILNKNNVQDQIDRWMASDPVMAEARIYGKFMQLSGAVFKAYNRDVHVVPAHTIPPNWNVYMGIDPHPQKPSVAVWMAVSPIGDWYVIAEYPSQDWELMISTHLTIKDFVTDWKLIEQGKDVQFRNMGGVYVNERFGDPNMLSCRQPINNRTFREEYERASGWDFTTDIDDSVASRHERVKDLIKYDMRRPIDSMNRPHLYIFDCCTNVKRAMMSYSYKQNQSGSSSLIERWDSVEPTWACHIACIGYILVSVGSWEKRLRKESDSMDAEYSQIRGDEGAENTFGISNYSGERLI